MSGALKEVGERACFGLGSDEGEKYLREAGELAAAAVRGDALHARGTAWLEQNRQWCEQLSRSADACRSVDAERNCGRLRRLFYSPRVSALGSRLALFLPFCCFAVKHVSSVGVAGESSGHERLGGIHHVHGGDDHRGCDDVLAVARAASLCVWTALSRTRKRWRSLWRGSRPDRAPGRSFSNHWRTGGGDGQVPDRAVGRHGAATAGRPGGGQAVSDELENSRIRPMLVARSALSGIAVEIFRSSDSHPVCLLPGAPALLSRCSLSVERLRRVARLPMLFDRLSRLEASRWVTLRSA